LRGTTRKPIVDRDSPEAHASTFAADRFAADQGLGAEPASALVALNDWSGTALGSSPWLARHPTSDRRIRTILTAAPLGLQGLNPPRTEDSVSWPGGRQR
jgi:hypothetical protein